MVFEGCQSKSKDITITEKICPQCGHLVEVFSVDTEVACDHCGFVVYNDALSCVQWCQHAKECVGEKMYEEMMQIVQERKQRKEAS